jgi:glutamyl-tRNA reductase
MSAPGANDEGLGPRGTGERGDSAFELRLVGLNHRTASTGIREALSYTEAEVIGWVGLAVEEGAIDLAGSQIREAALLSTCNRTEAYLVLTPPPPQDRTSELERMLTGLLCGGRSALAAQHAEAFYIRTGAEAVRHLYRVASGLDSMVQGEAQILGQVHRSHEMAREAQGLGPLLDRLFTSAFHMGKRARSETDIGRGAISVASAAVELAVKVVGSLNRRTVVVVGAGETGRLVAQHLAEEKPHELWIANRTLERAEELAREVNGRAISLEALASTMAGADLVVSATFAPEPIITRAMVQETARHRRRSLVFIDVSVPRNVEPSVHELEGAFVYDMDALQKVVNENLARRGEEIPRVEAILEEEIGQFNRWIGSLSAGPLIAQLRARFEDVRQEEVRRHARGLKAHEIEAVERATRGLLNKLLHGPTVHLRNGGRDDPASYDLIRRMFRLEEKPEEETRAEERSQDVKARDERFEREKP